MFHEFYSRGDLLYIDFFTRVQTQSVTIYTIKFNDNEICVMVPVGNIFQIGSFIYDGPSGSCHQKNIVYNIYTFSKFLFTS